MDSTKTKRPHHRNNRTQKPVVEKKPVVDTDSSDEEDELCFICTEPIITFAVGPCDHRTCHKCTLRLRALYDTRNCAYCKTEQKVVLFVKDAERPFESYNENDTPFTDKKWNIKFETREMYNDAMHMLDYNCPDCKETSKNWGELKQHVRKTHSLNICDLCSRFKKIFPYEHTLYTPAQLAKHLKEGDKDFNKDDETGFLGHPECEFCKIRFFGDDELFVHCRDEHEQCFLCVRNGRRHDYYANYNELEDHFRSEHCLCLYPDCLEKKFVVFDSPIDLKAHEVEVHGESNVGMQRSMQSQSRQLQLNFQYESFRDQQQHQRNRKGKKREDVGSSNSNSNSNSSSSTRAPVVAVNRNNSEDFPSMRDVQESLGSTTRVVPGASSKKGKNKALQKPAGFGALSQPQTTATPSPSSSPQVDAPTSVVASHTAFLSKVGDMLESKAKVAEFRSLTGAYRKSELTCEDYVNRIVTLANNNVEIANKIFAGVENLLDIEEKKWELIRAWRNKHTAMANFPALSSKGKAPAAKSARVLVIKGPKQGKKAAASSTSSQSKNNVWDKVASAATVATSTSSRTSSTHTSAKSSPQTSRPSSPINKPTPWSNNNNNKKTNDNFPSLKKPTNFPSLPKAPAKHQIVMDMRRNASGSSTANAWGSGSSSSGNEDDSSTTETPGKKKKGRKNNAVQLNIGFY